MATWTKVGTIRKSKKGGLYLKIDADVTLKKDEVLNMQDPRKKLDDSVAAGRLTEEKAEEIRAKIPDYIRQELYTVRD